MCSDLSGLLIAVDYSAAKSCSCFDYFEGKHNGSAFRVAAVMRSVKVRRVSKLSHPRGDRLRHLRERFA